MEWVRKHPALPHTLASLADKCSMSPRTLQRQFREVTGYAPSEWLVRERIGLVKEMLELSNQPLHKIAGKTGFGSEESLRRHFRRITQTSPAAYRRLFNTSLKAAA